MRSTQPGAPVFGFSAGQDNQQPIGRVVAKGVKQRHRLGIAQHLGRQDHHQVRAGAHRLALVRKCCNQRADCPGDQGLAVQLGQIGDRRFRAQRIGQMRPRADKALVIGKTPNRGNPDARRMLADPQMLKRVRRNSLGADHHKL